MRTQQSYERSWLIVRRIQAVLMIVCMFICLFLGTQEEYLENGKTLSAYIFFLCGIGLGICAVIYWQMSTNPPQSE